MYRLSGYLLVVATSLCAQQVSPTINNFPSREFGQPQLLPALNTIAPNLVEGRELFQPFAMAFDTSASPPILYVADTLNNRVLAWKNPAALGVCGTNNSGCGFADLAIGQRDLFSTLSGGPNGPSGLNVGLRQPTSVAVDSNGNLYVADAGNNRILRYPAPFKQNGLIQTDLVIGQKTVNSGNQGNEGNQSPSAKTLNFTPSGQFTTTGMAFDSSGNLWVTDPGNNRALRFPASQLSAGTIEPAADVVLGQLDFTTSSERQPPQGQPGGAPFFKGNLRLPSGIAFSQDGGLYISDNYNRVLYFAPGVGAAAVGAFALRILGLGINLQNQPPLPPVNSYQLLNPNGVAVSGNNLFVADTNHHRVVKYDVPANWPPEANLSAQPVTSQFSPPMIDVVGQADLNSGKANKGQPEADATTMTFPFGVGFLGTDLWVADSFNNRVTSFPPQSGKYVSAARLVGQLDWPFNAANLIEGREVSFGPSLGGVAMDVHSNPPHLYVADTSNNRILGFNDARNIQAGGRADIVIGQKDFYRALINGGTNDPQLPSQFGLNSPSGLVVDSNGNLYVADTGNGRVLRFPAPFSQPSGSQQLPNLVLGQQSFNSQFFDVTNQSMQSPVGLALFSSGGLAVSDASQNRILVFKPQNGDFTNGQAAAFVLGQPDPNSKTASNSAAGLNSPRHIAVDSSDRLYVADYGNSRLLVWTNGPQQGTGASSSSQFNGITQPQGIIVSQLTGEIWITNTGNDQILRLPEYNTLILNSTPNNFQFTTVQAQTPAVGIALDPNDNLVVAELANRVTFFYAALTFRHAATYNQQPIAPGMLVSLARLGKDLNVPTTTAQTLPWQTQMNDIQVIVHETPAPIYAMSSGIINIQVPTVNMPTSGNVEFRVVHPSTGEIVAVGQFPMAPYSPGFFTAGATGAGQVAAFNIANPDDPPTSNPINSPSNPVSRDGKHFIAFCLTGAGVFDGGPDPAPADGAAPPGQAATHVKPALISANGPGGTVPDADVTFSGAGCGYPGLWQVNFHVENSFPVSPNNVITLTMDSARANVGPNGQTIQVWFATK